MNAATAVARLAEPSQTERDDAAAELRRIITADPASAGDRGEAFWRAKHTAVKPGMTSAEVEAATGAKPEQGLASGQSATTMFRLDDYWTFDAIFDLHTGAATLREIGSLKRAPRAVWVEPGKGFSGRWVTYFVTGAKANDIDYAGGTYRRFSAYYDNSQLAYEQRYVDGKIDGVEVGFHRDGKKAYEISHAAGKNVGHSVHWYPNGKVQMEESYVDGELDGAVVSWREDGTRSSRIDYRAGKETGQAAWDEKGTLLYARGTAAER